MDVEHSGNRLSIDGKSIELEQEIEQVLALPDRLIVLFDGAGYAEADPRTNSNVVGMDHAGRSLWRIEQSSPFVVDGKPNANPFICVLLRDDGERIVACDTDGLDFDLDPATDELSNPIQTM